MKTLSTIFACFFLGSCATCDPTEIEPPPGEGEGEGEGDCSLISFGELVLDVQQDVQTIYSAEIQEDLGGIAPDFLVFHFVNYNERFGESAIGSFPLTTPPNNNRGSCAECIGVFEDQANSAAAPAKFYFQSAGNIDVERDPRQLHFKASISGLELVETIVDGATLESTPVEGGACFRVADFEVDLKIAPAGWTCDAELYDNGDNSCQCDCGVYDPDCSCNPFTDPSCNEADIVDDCEENEICSLSGCVQTCSLFSEPQVPCGEDQVCAFGNFAEECVDALGFTDVAQLGETCTRESERTLYCAMEGSLPGGVCDEFSGECKPICFGFESTEGCDAGEQCYTLINGFGYCRRAGNPPPEEWFCFEGSYDEGVSCDCACGAPDPDCENDELSVQGCDDDERCVEGECRL